MIRIYDEVIRELNEKLTGIAPVVYGGDAIVPWQEGGPNDIVLKPDMAYELGEGNRSACGMQMLTDNEEVFGADSCRDEILVYGPDLKDISGPIPFARVAMVLVDGDGLEKEADLYQQIRAIEYARYHIYPRGYMLRISAAQHREPVRVSKAALSQGLSFASVGALYLKEYHKYPHVKAVRQIFITDPSVDYEALEVLSKRSFDITGALDHVLKDFNMDCSTCKLKVICDEVEGMRELHFGQKK